MNVPVNPSLVNRSDYRRYHESFMQNNSGSSPEHTFLCILFTVLCAIYCSITPLARNKIFYIEEYVVIVVTLVLAHTLCAEYIYHLNLVAVMILLIKLGKICSKTNARAVFMNPNIFRSKLLTSISLMRALTYVITVFCILAVDFHVFPRFLAKTEQYGYSLMDTGVGLFVLMSGLVHKDYNKDKLQSFVTSNLKLFAILVILGISRFISIKQLDYQEHVTEYGVHWNFFFTLAIAKVSSSIVLYIFDPIKELSLLLSISTVVLHEWLLYIGLENWVFSGDPRDTILNANREGLSSCLGYVAMYLAAVHFKRIMCCNNVTRLYVLCHVMLASITSWVLASIFNCYRPASRTLANAGYIYFVLAILLTTMSILYFVEVILEENEKILFNVPVILSAINENGLLYFLVANLLTGAINLTIRTMLVERYVSVVLLNIYMICTVAVAMFLKRKGFKL